MDVIAVVVRGRISQKGVRVRVVELPHCSRMIFTFTGKVLRRYKRRMISAGLGTKHSLPEEMILAQVRKELEKGGPEA